MQQSGKSKPRRNRNYSNITASVLSLEGAIAKFPPFLASLAPYWSPRGPYGPPQPKGVLLMICTWPPKFKYGPPFVKQGGHRAPSRSRPGTSLNNMLKISIKEFQKNRCAYSFQDYHYICSFSLFQNFNNF